MGGVMTLGDGWDFAIVIPDNWYLRDPDLTTREASAVEFVEGLIADQPELAPWRADMLDRFRVFGNDADSKGAIIAAMLWQPAAEDLIAADLRIHEAERSAPASVDEELEMLRETFAKPEDGDLAERDVQVVELRAGRAVRLRVLSESAPGDEGETIALDVVQHWVPVPRYPDMIVLSTTTPNLVRADEIFEAVDEGIVDTLEFVFD